MRLAAVYIKDGEYNTKGAIGKFGEYDDSADAYKKNASDLGRPGTVQWLEVTGGLDERTLLAAEKTPNQAVGTVPAKVASGSYESVIYTAVVAGDAGNFSLVFDGVDTIATVVSAWNTANTGNTVSHDAGDDTVVPSAGNAELSGGYDAFTVTADDLDEEGNLADLTFDGSKDLDTTVLDWNTANDTNTVTHNAADGTIIPDAQALDLEGGVDAGWELVVDAGKQTQADADDLAASKAVLSAAYVEDVYDELEVQFGTRRDDTMNANMETWKLMSANATDFSSQGLEATRTTTTYTVGDVIDTDVKVAGWADECLADIVLYAIWRANRQKTYNDALAAL